MQGTVFLKNGDQGFHPNNNVLLKLKLQDCSVLPSHTNCCVIGEPT